MEVPFSFVLAQERRPRVLLDCGFMNEGGGAEMAIRFDVPWWISPLRMLDGIRHQAAPTSATSCSATPISTTWAASPNSPRRGSTSRSASTSRGWRRWRCRAQFGFITQVVHPDDLRTAFDASLDHRLNLIEGDKDNVLPGIHVRTGEGHTLGQQFIIAETAKGRIVVSGDCIYGARNILGNNNDGVYIPLGAGVGSTWDMVKTIDRINTEIGGDMSKLVILHDFDRWAKLPVVKEIEGFRILRAA